MNELSVEPGHMKQNGAEVLTYAILSVDGIVKFLAHCWAIPAKTLNRIIVE